jgi:PAS domain S-box-containing protein
LLHQAAGGQARAGRSHGPGAMITSRDQSWTAGTERMPSEGEQPEQLRAHIAQLEQALQAIRSGGIDSVIVGPPGEEQVHPIMGVDRSFRAIVDEMGEGAAAVSERGIVLYVNRQLADLLGQDRQQRVGSPAIELFGEEDREVVEGMLTLAPGGTGRAEVRLLHVSGRHVPVRLAVTCLDLDGTRLYCLIATDLTFSKEAERALAEHARNTEQANRQLAASNAELEQFAFVASHDLQEPLRMVSIYTTLLAEDLGGSLDGTARRHLDIVHDAALRMHLLVHDLLEYSRVGREADASPERVDCDQLVETAKADLHETIVAAGATVTHDRLPTVTGLRTGLQQLFTNLVGNAVKFRADEPPQVHVGVARDGARWLFSVADNGIGIDPAHAERIFEVFKRLHKPGQYPGTGIGLAICKKVIEHHGGRIWVESTPGAGATFHFTLPAEAIPP